MAPSISPVAVLASAPGQQIGGAGGERAMLPERTRPRTGGCGAG